MKVSVAVGRVEAALCSHAGGAACFCSCVPRAMRHLTHAPFARPRVTRHSQCAQRHARLVARWWHCLPFFLCCVPHATCHPLPRVPPCHVSPGVRRSTRRATRWWRCSCRGPPHPQGHHRAAGARAGHGHAGARCGTCTKGRPNPCAAPTAHALQHSSWPSPSWPPHGLAGVAHRWVTFCNVGNERYLALLTTRCAVILRLGAPLGPALPAVPAFSCFLDALHGFLAFTRTPTVLPADPHSVLFLAGHVSPH